MVKCVCVGLGGRESGQRTCHQESSEDKGTFHKNLNSISRPNEMEEDSTMWLSDLHAYTSVLCAHRLQVCMWMRACAHTQRHLLLKVQNFIWQTSVKFLLMLIKIIQNSSTLTFINSVHISNSLLYRSAKDEFMLTGNILYPFRRGVF